MQRDVLLLTEMIDAAEQAQSLRPSLLGQRDRPERALAATGIIRYVSASCRSGAALVSPASMLSAAAWKRLISP
jgi:hypothetical protein